jgi:CDP-paratose 2-epimerase
MRELGGAAADNRIAMQIDPVDIPFYVTDNTAVTAATRWRAEVSLEEMLDDIFEWLREHRGEIEAILK